MCNLCVEVHPYDRVREIFGDIPDEECDWILWEKTGWPSFFTKFPDDLYTQLKKYKQSAEQRETTP